MVTVMNPQTHASLKAPDCPRQPSSRVEASPGEIRRKTSVRGRSPSDKYPAMFTLSDPYSIDLCAVIVELPAVLAQVSSHLSFLSQAVGTNRFETFNSLAT